MKKLLLFGVLYLFFTSFVYAYEAKDNKMLEEIKARRESIYNSLDLSVEQKNQINAIDKSFYEKILPELSNMSLYVEEVKEIANSNNCSIKRIKEIKKEFDISDKKISALKNNHEKQFKKILTKTQNTKYKALKKQKQLELEEEIKKIQQEQKA